MKKIIIVLILFCLPILSVSGQNYIQNGSFELKQGCTGIVNLGDFSVYITPPWFCNMTSEIYDNCGSLNFRWPKIYPGIYSTPVSFQKPRTGLVFMGEQIAGINMTTEEFYRGCDYASSELFQILDSGYIYIMKFYISLQNPAIVGIDGIDVHLSQDSILAPYILGQTTPPVQIYNIPQNNITYSHIGKGCITDTVWYEIRDTFIANGFEKFITIGCFTEDSLISWQNPWGSLPLSYYSLRSNAIYYYFDDIAIYRADTLPPVSNTGNDTTICIGGKATLGKHNYSDYYYEWFTKDTAAINNTNIWNKYNIPNLLKFGYLHYEDQLNLIDSTGIIEVNPTQTTTYYCLATDFTYTKTLDSVTVYVVDCGHANDTTVCVEQAFILGSQSLPQYTYKWSPPTFLNYDTIGQPQCSPTNDITYYLLITNSINDTVSLDTVNIFVVNCYSAEAGLDTTLCLGDSIQLGSHNHSSCTYVWWPSQWLSDSTMGMPFAKPDTLIKYFLQVVDTLGNVSVDSILIGVVDCDTVGIDEARLNIQEIKVHPNPTTGQLNIEISNELNGVGRIIIRNVLGKTVYTKQINQGINSLNLESLDNSIYIYSIYDNTTIISTGKFILNK